MTENITSLQFGLDTDDCAQIVNLPADQPNDQKNKCWKRDQLTTWLARQSRLVANGGAKVQVTGQRSGHRLQATGHRSGHRSHTKNNRTMDKTVLDRRFTIQK